MKNDWLPDRAVLFTVGAGLIAVLLALVIGIFNVKPVGAGQAGIPNWAENVLVAVATGALLKIGDVISAVVTLSSNRQVERLGNQLGQSAPASDSPQSVTIDQPANKPVPVEEHP
jgi:ABC-type uncharacterized transport system permease subunit